MIFTVAVTRPLPQGTQTASRLVTRGYAVVSAPLLVPEDVGDWGSPAGIGALAITSRTSAMQLANHPEFHAIPTFCVGAASTSDAKKSGATSAESADGDVDALLALLKARAKAPVVHLSGADQKGDLVERLMADGIEAERRIVYKMAPATALPPVDGPLHATLLYSPRTARLYKRLATVAPWREAPCVVMSEAVANQVPEGVVSIVSERPDEAALFDALDRLRSGR